MAILRSLLKQLTSPYFCFVFFVRSPLDYWNLFIATIHCLILRLMFVLNFFCNQLISLLDTASVLSEWLKCRRNIQFWGSRVTFYFKKIFSALNAIRWICGTPGSDGSQQVMSFIKN